ncbi:MAG: hypothetical protein WC421_04780 [Elusimicrobiales bacterium]
MKGMTTLEMLVAGALFMVFASSFSSAWITSRKQTAYMLERSRTLRESLAARAWLARDMKAATDVESHDESGYFVINPSGGHSITYTLELQEGATTGRLLRYEEISATTMTVANQVGSFSCSPVIDNSKFTANYELRSQGVASSTNPVVNLEVFWSRVAP